MMQKVFLKSYYQEYRKVRKVSILFNIFINYLFLFINKAKLANFADDNTIYANSPEIAIKCETAIKWFKQN